MEKETKTEDFQIDILECAKAVLKRWYIVVGAMLIGVILAFMFFVVGYQPQYSATAKFYVNNNSDSNSWSQSDITASRSLVQEYLVVLKSRPTLDKACESVNEEYGYDLTYKELEGKINGGAIDKTTVFQVTITDTSPEKAVNIVNGIANSFPSEVEKIFDKSSARVIEYAVEAREIEAGHTTKLCLGAVIGCFIACIYIIIMNVFVDDVITSNDWLIQKYDNKIPMIADIPDIYSQVRHKKFDFHIHIRK